MSDEILFIGTLALFTFIGYTIGSEEQGRKDVTVDLSKMATEDLEDMRRNINNILDGREKADK